MSTFDYQRLEDVVLPGGYAPAATAGDCVFDAEQAQRACEFFPAFLVHVKGPLAGRPFELDPWQRDATATLFGWRRPDGTRRYRRAYIQVARKNGKTTWVAGKTLYLLACDGEPGAEIYTAATKREQQLYKIAASMVRRNPALRKRIRVLRSYHRMVHAASDSIFEALPGVADAGHSLNPSAVVADELHLWPNNGLWESLETGQGARAQPMLLGITTAGNDEQSLCAELYREACAVRDGEADVPELLPVIHEVARDEDWTDESVWPKANPGLGHSVQIEKLREECRRAKRTPSYENTFRQLYLDQWTQSAKRWVSSEAWRRCHVPRDQWPDLTGLPSWGGLDLGATDDLTAYARVWRTEDGHWWARVRCWVPADTVRAATKAFQKRYRTWVAQGWLIETPGAVTDYEQVQREIVEDCLGEAGVHPPPKEIGFDKWQAIDLANRLRVAGLEMVEVQQQVSGLGAGTRALEEAVLAGTFHHDGDPCLAWQVSCTTPHIDSAGNCKPDKRASCGPDNTKGKIDAVVALCMAFDRGERAGGRSVYDDRDPRTLE